MLRDLHLEGFGLFHLLCEHVIELLLHPLNVKLELLLNTDVCAHVRLQLLYLLFVSSGRRRVLFLLSTPSLVLLHGRVVVHAHLHGRACEHARGQDESGRPLRVAATLLVCRLTLDQLLEPLFLFLKGKSLVQVPILDVLLVLFPLHVHEDLDGLPDVVEDLDAVNLIQTASFFVQVVITKVGYLSKSVRIHQ